MLDQPTNERRLTIARAMAEAMQQEMQRDPTVFVMGEDIGGFGGIFGNTRGLFEEFGKEPKPALSAPPWARRWTVCGLSSN